MAADTQFPDAEAFLAEHQELLRQVADVQKWWAQVAELGVPRFGEMGLRLQALRDMLDRHFAGEEQGGYLMQVLTVAPHLRDEADELLTQHGQLLEALDELIARLREPDPPFDSWQSADRDFRAFLEVLRRHEGRENALVQAVL